MPTPLAEKALKCAERLLEWLSRQDNIAAANELSIGFIGSLRGCFQAYCTVRAGREQMWESYYKLRSSEKFRDRWGKFLNESIGSEACPIFYERRYIPESFSRLLYVYRPPYQSLTLALALALAARFARSA